MEYTFLFFLFTCARNIFEITFCSLPFTLNSFVSLTAPPSHRMLRARSRQGHQADGGGRHAVHHVFKDGRVGPGAVCRCVVGWWSIFCVLVDEIFRFVWVGVRGWGMYWFCAFLFFRPTLVRSTRFSRFFNPSSFLNPFSVRFHTRCILHFLIFVFNFIPPCSRLLLCPPSDLVAPSLQAPLLVETWIRGSKIPSSCPSSGFRSAVFFFCFDHRH